MNISTRITPVSLSAHSAGGGSNDRVLRDRVNATRLARQRKKKDIQPKYSESESESSIIAALFTLTPSGLAKSAASPLGPAPAPFLRFHFRMAWGAPPTLISALAPALAPAPSPSATSARRFRPLREGPGSVSLRSSRHTAASYTAAARASAISSRASARN